MFRLIALIAALLMAPAPSDADQRQYLGYGHLIVNDNFVDKQDRWRTGSVAASFAWGPEWTGTAPTRLGQMLELRLSGQILSPESLTRAPLRDRRYAGALSFGLHTHQSRGATEISLGADLILTGPQTGLDRLQSRLHSIAGIDGPSNAVRDRQIGNKEHLAAVLEIGHRIPFHNASHIRPFVELRTGEETLARAGFDIILGQMGRNALLVRDPVTGHRYSVIEGSGRGLSVVLGADIARVADSVYLPDDSNLLGPLGSTSASRQPVGTRERIRAGLHWQGQKTTLFYGLTWLSREFRAQSEGQLTGAIQLRMRF